MSYAGLRALAADDRLHTAAAIVCTPDGESEHFYVNEEGDIVVNCILHRGGTLVRANLSALVGARGQGVWVIPDPGVEVMVGFDAGDVEGEAYLLATFPSGRSPSGLAPGKVFVIGMSVEVRSANGTAAKVATKADVDALANYVDHGLVLTVATTGTATAQSGTATVATTTAPAANGTNVLLAE